MENIKCICCSKEIIPLYPEHHSYDKPWSGMFKNGTVDRIFPNYGSDFDTRTLIIGVCDDCIKINLEKGLLIDKGDWTAGHPIEILKINTYRDGGTVEIKTSEGIYCIDGRIGSQTKGKFFFGYPGEEDSYEIPNQFYIRNKLSSGIIYLLNSPEPPMKAFRANRNNSYTVEKAKKILHLLF